MFFMIGITDGRKDLPYDRMIICGNCGAYGRYRVYMTFTQLLLFFIPTFKWNRQYYVETSCCETTFLLNPEAGKRIEKGEAIEIRPENLTPLHVGSPYTRIRSCSNCGYSTTEDFSYCPKCGQPF